MTSDKSQSCDDGRCRRVRMGEKIHPKHNEKENKFTYEKWQKFTVFFWGLMVLLVITFVAASWNNPESVTQKIASITSVLALFFTVYIAVWAYRSEYLKKYETLRRTNHAKEEIYSTLRSIEENRKQRERIRTMNPKAKPDVDLNIEIRFMNYKLKRVIESLQFVLSLHSEYLPDKFVSRVNDAIDGYDFILNRLDVLPLENDDPKKVLAGGAEGFIDELKTL